MITVYSSIRDMDLAVAEANAKPTEAECVAALCDLALDPAEEGSWLRSMDPFSPEYRDVVIEIYAKISGRQGYSPRLNELSPYLVDISDSRPGYYLAGSTTFAGEIICAMGSVLQTLALRPGQKLLEFGAGEGGIALEAAKCGADVTVVDIEKRYLSLIERRAHAAGVSIRTVLAEFGTSVGEGYDVVLFYEAFHHSLDHMAVAERIKSMLLPGGRLILAGEPVIGSHNEHWRPAVPFPWGLRMDGLSYRAIKAYGWMELGFQHEYLLEMLKRAGYTSEFLRSPATPRADCYIARVAA